MEEEKEKVLEAWKRGNKALQENDWERYQSYWGHTDYIELIHPKEKEWLRGWQEIGPGYKQLISQEPAIEATFTDISVHVSPHADMAWLSCKVVIKINHEEEIELSSWQTNIFEKIEDEWKLVCAHASNFY